MSHVQLMRIYFAVVCMSVRLPRILITPGWEEYDLGMGSQGAKGVVMLDISNLW